MCPPPSIPPANVLHYIVVIGVGVVSEVASHCPKLLQPQLGRRRRRRRLARAVDDSGGGGGGGGRLGGGRLQASLSHPKT